MISIKKLMEDVIDDFKSIVDLPVSSFVDQFKTLATDKKVQTFLKSGLFDGSVPDDKMKVSIITIPVKNLRPTQNIIGQAESLSSLLDDRYSSLNSFLNNINAFKDPILTFNGKWIIDGHHRWSQLYVANPNATLQCANIVDKSHTPDEILKVMHMAIAADAKKLPLSTAKGVNLLTASLSTLGNIIKQEMQPKALKVFIENGCGNNLEEVSKYLLMNVKSLQKHKPMPGAPDRSKMPQTGEAPRLMSLLPKGVINFMEPYEKV